jgi:hypothetical protein
MSWKLCFITILLVATFSVAQGQQLQIHITSPKDMDSVSQRHLVTGTVSDTTAIIWVVIHPMVTSDFWIQPKVNKRGNSWNVTVYIGDETHGIGEQFELSAIVNPRKTLKETMKFQEWPESESKSEIIEVTRKK